MARSRVTQIPPPSPPTRAPSLSHPTAAIKEVTIEFTIGGANKYGISVARRLAEIEHMDAYSRNQ